MKRTIFHAKRIIFRLFAFLLTVSFLFLFSSVKAEDGEETEMPDNGIPVVYVNVDESQGTIEDMLASEDHSVYCYGTISIEVPEGFHYSDFPDLECLSMENLAMSIRGRGNTTWASKTDKKPFKIKLDKKADVFGLGKNKHWVLVANHYDESLMRDRVTAWLGEEMGFEFTPRGVPVDFVLRGETWGTKYLGSYYFSENVRVDDSRLEIDELGEEDVEEPAITGGYLLQNALQVREGSPDRFYTSRGIDWATHTPSFDTEEEALLGSVNEDEETEETFTYPELGDAYENPVQQTYIQNHIQKIEDALFEDGTEYKDLVDIESAAKYWLVNEFSLNGDAFATGSTYIYKKRDENGVTGKLFWGPLWDFDFAWDNGFNVTGMSPGHKWMHPMFTDRADNGFVEEVKKQWPVMREAIVKLIEEGGIMDQYYTETAASGDADYRMYHPGKTDDYKSKVEKLRDWIRRRLEWFDENFSMVDNLVHKVNFIVNGEVYDTQYIVSGASVKGDEPHPDIEGYVFIGWYDENDQKIVSDTEVTEDMILSAKYIPESEATFAQDIVFRRNSDAVKLTFWGRYYQIPYRIIPEDADDKTVEWSSSDEEFATVDENGMIYYSGAGTVTITAKLKHGQTRTFTLTILEEEPPYPEAIIAEEDVIRMNTGDLSAVTIRTEPANAVINSYSYSSEDESIVSVDDFGVITALAPGETYIHVNTSTNGENWGDYILLETVVKVIVSEETPVPSPDPEPSPEPKEIIYTVTDGNESTWQKGTEQEITLTVKRSEEDDTCFSHFKGVRIDGTDLKKDGGYTAKAGSTIVTLKADALKLLKEGTHTVTVLFDDGQAEAKITVLKADEPSSPDTSDRRNMSWAYVGAVALLVFAMSLAARLRHG